MAFKLPLPITRKNSKQQRIPSVLDGIPHFSKKEFSDVQMIGQGTFGTVFKASKDGKKFVIKELKASDTTESDIKLFKKEALLLKSLNGHKNIIQICGFSTTENSILLEYMAFNFQRIGIEHASVHSLKDFLFACDDINDFNGFYHVQNYLASDIINGLAVLHSKGIAHRDLKPDNILVSNLHYENCSEEDVGYWWSEKPITAKLTDFGESRSSLVQTETLIHTSTCNLRRGSIAYMSPEALVDNKMDKARVDDLQRMDIWSLGMVLFNLINPNVRYPYYLEINDKKPAVARDEVQRLLSEQIHPAFHDKYAKERSEFWATIEDLYHQTVNFNPIQRPSANELARIISLERKRDVCIAHGKNDTKEITIEHNRNGKNSVKHNSEVEPSEKPNTETNNNAGKNIATQSVGDKSEKQQSKKHNSETQNTDTNNSESYNNAENNIATYSLRDKSEKQQSNKYNSETHNNGRHNSYRHIHNSERHNAESDNINEGDNVGAPNSEVQNNDDEIHNNDRHHGETINSERYETENHKSGTNNIDSNKNDRHSSETHKIEIHSNGRHSYESHNNGTQNNETNNSERHTFSEINRTDDIRCEQKHKQQRTENNRVISILGDFHQASPNIFCHAASGTQCSTICLLSLIKAKHKDQTDWIKTDINEVLTEGDSLHVKLLQDKGWPYNRKDAKLGIDELPSFFNCRFGDNYLTVSTGFLEPSFGLSETFEETFVSCIDSNQKQNFIIRMFGKCRAVSRCRNGTFGVFDPHSCDSSGKVIADGAACLLLFRSFSGLMKHLRSLLPQGVNEQIDVTPVDVEIMWEGHGMDRCSDIAGGPSNDEPLTGSIVLSSSSSSTDVPHTQSETNSLNLANEDNDYEFIGLKKGRFRNTTLNPSHWTSCTPQEVTELPYDIDGTVVFKLKADRENFMKISKDGRPWGKWFNSSRKGLVGVRRVARCKGASQCINPNCEYLKHYGYKNMAQFQSTSGVRVCFVCGLPAESVDCSAVKIWELDKWSGYVTIMHKGRHTCMPRKPTISKHILKQAVEANPKSKPNKLVNDKLVNMMTSEFSWEEVEDIAEQFVDMKTLYNVRDEMKSDQNPCGENFDALGLYKKKCDERDKYFIYKINNKDLNGNPSYVFKSSEDMAKLAISMDCNGDGPLNEQYAFVDAKHDRTRGFKTITLWTYHPVTRKVVCLAIMEVENENTENLILFWKILNDMLQKYSCNDRYQFNPIGIVCDENHANWKSIEHVFGQEGINKTVSCEFHYKQSIERQKRKLPDSADTFVKLANNLLESLTVAEFNKSCSELQAFMTKYPFLNNWFEWWNNRRTHIFKAFKPDSAPASNIAEIGHAKLESVGRRHMSLLETAREDVVLAIRQAAELRLFESGTASGGKGPNQRKQKIKEYRKGLKRAAAFANELDEEAIPMKPKRKFVPTSGQHRPKEKTNYSTFANPFSLVFYAHVFQLKKCYGCGKDFKDKYKNPPNDIVLKHNCFRKYKDKNGNLKTSKTLQAAYFHLKLDCTRKVSPFMELSDVLIYDEIRPHLTDGHKRVLRKFGLQLD